MTPEKPSYFDVPYAIPSSKITATADQIIITTTGAEFLGFTMSATSAGATLIIYDDFIATTSGSFIYATSIGADAILSPDRSLVVKAKKGIVVSITGTGAAVVVFYTPKG